MSPAREGGESSERLLIKEPEDSPNALTKLSRRSFVGSKSSEPRKGLSCLEFMNGKYTVCIIFL